MSTKALKSRARSRRRSRSKALWSTWGPWIAVALIGGIGLAIWIGGRSPSGGAVAQPQAAPAFSLPTTGGGTVSLSAFRGEDVLLYFNEGVGCDACFYQMTSLEKDMKILKDAGIQAVVPILVNPMDQVQAEVQRFGLKTPWAVDGDRSVSEAYGMLGTGMHADLPGHGFVLVDGQGDVVWKMNYPSMYASAQQIVKDAGSALQQ